MTVCACAATSVVREVLDEADAWANTDSIISGTVIHSHRRGWFLKRNSYAILCGELATIRNSAFSPSDSETFVGWGAGPVTNLYQVIAIRGTPGVGKTVFSTYAVHFAQKYFSSDNIEVYDGEGRLLHREWKGSDRFTWQFADWAGHGENRLPLQPSSAKGFIQVVTTSPGNCSGQLYQPSQDGVCHDFYLGPFTQAEGDEYLRFVSDKSLLPTVFPNVSRPDGWEGLDALERSKALLAAVSGVIRYVMVPDKYNIVLEFARDDLPKMGIDEIIASVKVDDPSHTRKRERKGVSRLFVIVPDMDMKSFTMKFINDQIHDLVSDAVEDAGHIAKRDAVVSLLEYGLVWPRHHALAEDALEHLIEVTTESGRGLCDSSGNVLWAGHAYREEADVADHSITLTCDTVVRLRKGAPLADFVVPDGFIQATTGAKHDWKDTKDIRKLLGRLFDSRRKRLKVYWVCTNPAIGRHIAGDVYPKSLELIDGKRTRSVTLEHVFVHIRPHTILEHVDDGAKRKPPAAPATNSKRRRRS